MANFLENKAKKIKIQEYARQIYEKTTLPEEQVAWTGIEEAETLKILQSVWKKAMGNEIQAVESTKDAVARKTRIDKVINEEFTV